MRAEVSCPVSLNIMRPTVKEAFIGDRVRLKYEFEGEWLRAIKEACPKIRDKEHLELHPYTHRLYVELENVEDELDEQLKAAKQLVIQAIFVSRIVRPTPIASGNIWIESYFSENGTTQHQCNVKAGFQSQAYVTEFDTENTLSDEDAKIVSTLWPALHFYLDNHVKFKRLVRAIKLVEIAYHLYYGELRHTTLHSALESMICTSSKRNRAQVTKRLPQLVPFVTNNQAGNIYSLCCDLKHAAAPLQLFPTGSDQRDPKDQPRFDAVNQLERAVRYLIYKALSELDFAEKLSDPARLETECPI